MPKGLKIFIGILVIIVAVVIISIQIFKVFNIKGKINGAMYPKAYSEYVEEYSKEFEVDPLLVYALIKNESKFNNNSVSNKNAKGVMQLMESTASEVASNVMTDETFEADMLFDANVNIKLGVKYLSELMQKYNGNCSLALAAYNAGQGTVDKWIQDGIIKSDGSDIENIPYMETNNYVRKIMRDYEMYKSIY